MPNELDDDLRDVYDFSKLKKVPEEKRVYYKLQSSNVEEVACNRRSIPLQEYVESGRLDVVNLLARMVKGMQEWGAEEDGIPDFCWDAYSDAIFKLYGERPDPKDS